DRRERRVVLRASLVPVDLLALIVDVVRRHEQPTIANPYAWSSAPRPSPELGGSVGRRSRAASTERRPADGRLNAPMNRRRLIQTLILVIGLVGIAFAISKTVNDAQEQVLPSLGAWIAAALLALGAIAFSARA